MTMLSRRAVLLAVLALAACAPKGPPFGSVAETLPPVPPDEARIFFYRWLEPYESLAETRAYLNGRAVGVTQNGSVLYRDVPPGQYLVSVDSRGQYPNQFKTVVLRAGDVAYARIGSLRSWACGGGADAEGGGAAPCDDTFVVQIMDPATARIEIEDLPFVPG